MTHLFNLQMPGADHALIPPQLSIHTLLSLVELCHSKIWKKQSKVQPF